MASAAATSTRTTHERTCISCGKKARKLELLRVVRTGDGQAAFDASGKAAGRGAYVCSPACFSQAAQTGKLARALKTSLDRAALEAVSAQIDAYQASAIAEQN